MQKVLLFSDPGIDDSFAIIYALLHPQIELVGIVTGYGSVKKEQATQNAAYLLQLANQRDIPIIGGAQGPLSGESVTYYPEIHGPEGLGPIKPPEGLKVNLLNFDQIYKIIDQYQNELIIVSIGRLTELAVAFILGADQMEKVKSFHVMGGAFLVPGNVSPVAEANFYGDPIAADLVMQRSIPLKVFPLNVTNQALVTPEVIQYISQTNATPFQPLLEPIYDYYLKAYKKNIPGIPGAPLHDVLTLSSIFNPTMVDYYYREVRVVLSGVAKGQSIADFRPKPDPVPEENLKGIAMKLNYELFLKDFVEIMTSETSNTTSTSK
ncbi:nucleoside hydrolase [Bacillus pinisoli]|uniref:nucleoside hydrolase n=1 Tax=Bacillus pinisoli TaxID=2901866 RepID=UPI001FF6D311|nr:nucleoside hydrolase [Bacillus pinisoli]